MSVEMLKRESEELDQQNRGRRGRHPRGGGLAPPDGTGG